MKYIEIQTEIMKDLLKTCNNSRFSYCENDGSTLIVNGKGTVVYNICNNFMWLDTSKLNKKACLEQIASSLHLEENPTVKPTGIIREVDKIKVVQFAGNDFNIYVNEKLLKPFDFGKYELTFKAKNSTSPMAIYDGSYLLGIVMPVKVNE